MSLDDLCKHERIKPLGVLDLIDVQVPLYICFDGCERVLRPLVFGGYLPDCIPHISPEQYQPMNDYLVFDPKECMSPMRCPR